MPPQKHYSKSQEHIYVKVGKGPRARYKMMATDIPQEGGSSTRGPDPAAMPAAPPIISTPLAADDTQSFPDPMDDYGTRPKRTGKVRLECMS